MSLNKTNISFVSPCNNKLLEIERLFVDSCASFRTEKGDLTISPTCEEDDLQQQAKSSILIWKYRLGKPCFAEVRWIEWENEPGILFVPYSKELSEMEKFDGKKGKLVVHVVYAEDNTDQLHQFQKKIGGSLQYKKKDDFNNCEILIDRIWVPEGYSKTLAQLGEHLCIQNEPYLDLAEKLRRHIFEGTMEIHVFVAPINPNIELQQQFKESCSSISTMKCCNLRLNFVKQGWLSVLMSSRYVRGQMTHVWRETFQDARAIALMGFDVIRVKIEASASICGVPASNEEAQILPKKTYFEFHMVFSNGDGTTPTDDQVSKVEVIAKRLEKEWHSCIPLSTNAFGTQKFVNMRTYGIGRDESYPRLEQLAKEVESAGFKVPRFIREFGVYDSDVTIDCGWLEPLEPTDIIGFLPPIVVS